MTPTLVDGQWLDFYALLDVPVNADEDTLRKRIGKIYAEARANSEHRDLARRHYFVALVESVLPQCRRVLLDEGWRTKYNHQHRLHEMGDPSAQPYVAFIAAMRGQTAPDDMQGLPSRAQEEITLAREAIEAARAGTELDLLPSHAVPHADNRAPHGFNAPPLVDEAPHTSSTTARPASPESKKAAPIPSAQHASSTKASPSETAKISTPPLSSTPVSPVSAVNASSTNVSSTPTSAASISSTNVSSTTVAATTVARELSTPSAPRVETVHQAGEPVRAQTLTAQEAAEIRRRRASNAETSHSIIGDGVAETRQRTPRVVVEKEASRGRRVLSPTSLNLMVAITGVLFTITIQQFTSTPAVATDAGRVPITIAVAPELEASLGRAEAQWESGEGAGFDIILAPVEGEAGVRRALSRRDAPDAWIPSEGLWIDKYNALAAKSKRETLMGEASLVQTPMVLVARADRADGLRQRFPNRRIGSWAALQDAVQSQARGRFGLSDPQTTATGALARFSMAREWGAARNLSAQKAAQNPQFWKWMSGFEENVPANIASSSALLKDLVLGTTGRFWWALGYESEALRWIDEGKDLEIFYLPRTALADHPFCAIERVGASVEVERGRTSFARFLRSDKVQREMLRAGFRPTEIAPTTKVKGNPFINPQIRARGARLEGLARDERPNFGAIEAVAKGWDKRFG